MRRFLLTTTLLALTASPSLAQDAPVFRPLDPSMTAAPVATPAPQTTPAPAAAPAATASAPLPVSHSGEVIDSVGSGAIPSLPLEVMKENGITYMSGGISDEETEQLKSQADMYNLHLLLTGPNGEFLGGAVMVLKDESGKTLLTLQDAGPEVYAQLPAGKYTVDITNAAGLSKSATVKVPAKGAVKTQIRV